MALKAALTVGGLATTAVATVSIAYVATSGSQGDKTIVGFDSDGLCHYKRPAVFSTGGIGAGDAASPEKNVCLQLSEGKMDWKDVKITGNHYEKYKNKKGDALKQSWDKWEAEKKKTQSGTTDQ